MEYGNRIKTEIKKLFDVLKRQKEQCMSCAYCIDIKAVNDKIGLKTEIHFK